jgi:hypothetical protein
MRLLHGFIVALRTNNNIRSWTLVVLAIVILLTALSFGFGPANEILPRSEVAQRYYNYHYHGSFATDTDMSSWTGTVGGAIESLFRTGSWIIALLLLIAAPIYFIVARRDEAGRAWEHARNMVLEIKAKSMETVDSVKASLPQMPSMPSLPKSVTSELLTQARIFVREFFAAFLGDAMFGRKRR